MSPSSAVQVHLNNLHNCGRARSRRTFSLPSSCQIEMVVEGQGSNSRFWRIFFDSLWNVPLMDVGTIRRLTMMIPYISSARLGLLPRAHFQTSSGPIPISSLKFFSLRPTQPNALRPKVHCEPLIVVESKMGKFMLSDMYRGLRHQSTGIRVHRPS